MRLLGPNGTDLTLTRLSSWRTRTAHLDGETGHNKDDSIKGQLDTLSPEEGESLKEAGEDRGKIRSSNTGR